MTQQMLIKNRTRAIYILFACLVTLFSSANLVAKSDESHVINPLETADLTCRFTDVVFKVDFEGARLNSCQQSSASEFVLSTDAENRPINPSPWYAFKVESSLAQDIGITLHAIEARPRYLPKISTDGKNWQALEFSLSDQKMHFTIPSSDIPIWIAGQEILDNQSYVDWKNELIAKSDKLQHLVIGNSTQGRAIHAYVSQHQDNNEWVVILGRQHPPEITGALALKTFVETMYVDAINPEFFERFNVFIVPNVNPDGVAAGNWRHSTQGADLNRDWHKFEQIETRVVRDKMLALMGEQGKLVFALDFHSTQQDIFYTMPTDYHVAPALLVNEWLEALKPRLVSSFVIRERPGSSPGRGVFKQYIADQFNVHAVTYEMGDNTERVMIDHVAREAAVSLMDKLLSVDSEAFVYVHEKTNETKTP